MRSLNTNNHHQTISTIFGQPFTKLSQQGALQKCESLIRETKGSHVMTANVDFLTRTDRNENLRKMLLEADEVLCDGMPLVWASRLPKIEPLPERVTGSDLVPKLLERCADCDFRVFFFGSDENTLNSLKEKLSSDLPKLKIVGAISPPLGELDSWDNDSYLEKIESTKPDLLLVALGFPKQDQWIERFAKNANIPLSIGIGASLDFLVGKQTRSPKWLQKIGFEWLWRLGTDPSRLAGRYAEDMSTLVKLLGKHALWDGTTRFGLLPRRGISKRVLLNGIDTRQFRITTFTSENSIEINEPINGHLGEICDCSGIDHVNADVINTIISTRREAAKAGKRMVLFSPSPALSLWLKLFKVDTMIKSFDSPIALRSYFYPEIPIRIPDGNLTSRARQFEAITSEAFSMGDSDIARIDLTTFNTLTRDTGTCLTSIAKHANREGTSLKVESLSPQTEDIIEILGINDVELTS